jgi:hypothetical protein
MVRSDRRIPSGMIRRGVVAALAAAMAASPLTGQEVRTRVGAGPVFARPLGSLEHYMSSAYGAGGFVEFGPAARALALRIDGSYVRFAPTTSARPFRGPQPVFITTGSQIFLVVGGPELRVGLGRVRLTATAGGGIASSTNTGAVTGIAAPDRFSGATTFGDLTLAYAGGAGLGLEVHGGAAPVWLDLATRYVGTGPTRWVREGNLPVGYVSGVYLKPTKSPTRLVAFQLSVSVGVPR